MHKLAYIHLQFAPRLSSLADIVEGELAFLLAVAQFTDGTQRVGKKGSDMRTRQVSRTNVAKLAHSVLLEQSLCVVAGEDGVAGVIVRCHVDMDINFECV